LLGGAKLKLLETFVGDSGAGETNAVFDYDIADKAELAVTRLIEGDGEGAKLFTTLATSRRRGTFKARSALLPARPSCAISSSSSLRR
jgi:Fe-S cluster assembly protein SufD